MVYCTTTIYALTLKTLFFKRMFTLLVTVLDVFKCNLVREFSLGTTIIVKKVWVSIVTGTINGLLADKSDNSVWISVNLQHVFIRYK